MVIRRRWKMSHEDQDVRRKVMAKMSPLNELSAVPFLSMVIAFNSPSAVQSSFQSKKKEKNRITRICIWIQFAIIIFLYYWPMLGFVFLAQWEIFIFGMPYFTKIMFGTSRRIISIYLLLEKQTLVRLPMSVRYQQIT